MGYDQAKAIAEARKAQMKLFPDRAFAPKGAA